MPTYNMKQCGWSRCDSFASNVYSCDIPLISAYSCKIHITYYCKLCDHIIMLDITHEGNDISDYKFDIGLHFMMKHTLNPFNGNYLSWSYNQPILVNKIYYTCGRVDGGRFCYLTNILKTNPHIVYLIPEFSFSDILDQFDKAEVPDWRLLSAIQHKQFSCLICDGIFESFPSSEVFAAHPCKS